MPSVKLPRKSTATDMTPFVDVAFLILSFFMLATKFKPPAPVEIATPHSVSADKLEEQDAVFVELDSAGRVFFTLNIKNPEDEDKRMELIKNLNTARNLGLTEAQMANFQRNSTIGVPFSGLKQVLSLPHDKRNEGPQPGIPVDSTNNELSEWVGYAVNVFKGSRLNLMVKGDNAAKYPAFKGIIEAFRKNEQFKYQLITDPEDAPYGTDLYTQRQQERQ